MAAGYWPFSSRHCRALYKCARRSAPKAPSQRPGITTGAVRASCIGKASQVRAPRHRSPRGHGLELLSMTDSPAILLAAGGPKTRPRGGRVLAPTRYRHPGDVIRLIAAAGLPWRRDRCAAACAAPAGQGGDHRGQARDRGRAGADRPGPGDDRGGGPGAAGRRTAAPPVPRHGHRGGRVRGGGRLDDRDYLPGRAGRLRWPARRAAPGFLAGRRRLPRSGRPGGAGGGRGGRRAVAEPGHGAGRRGPRCC